MLPRELKSAALCLLVLFVVDANAASRKKKRPSGETIYSLFPKSIQSRLKTAWKAEVKRTEKQVKSMRRAATRERSKEKKAKLKEAFLLAEAALEHLKKKNDPPFVGIRMVIGWKTGSVGLCKYPFKVFQVIDGNTSLLDSGNIGPRGVFMLKGVSTKDFTDGNRIAAIHNPLWVSGTTQYTTVLGGTKTVYVVEPFDWEKWKKANVKK